MSLYYRSLAWIIAFHLFSQLCAAESAADLDSLKIRSAAGAAVLINAASGPKAWESGYGHLLFQKSIGPHISLRSAAEYTTSGNEFFLKEASIKYRSGLFSARIGYMESRFGGVQYYISPGEMFYFSNRGVLYRSNGFGYSVDTRFGDVYFEHAASLNKNENGSLHVLSKYTKGDLWFSFLGSFRTYDQQLQDNFGGIYSEAGIGFSAYQAKCLLAAEKYFGYGSNANHLMVPGVQYYFRVEHSAKLGLFRNEFFSEAGYEKKRFEHYSWGLGTNLGVEFFRCLTSGLGCEYYERNDIASVLPYAFMELLHRDAKVRLFFLRRQTALEHVSHELTGDVWFEF